MKTLCLLTPLFLILLSCNNDKKIVTDSGITHHKQIKQIIEENYNIDKKHGKILPISKWPEWSTEIYNEKNQKTESSWYSNDTLTEKLVLEYCNDLVIREYKERYYPKYFKESYTTYRYNNKNLLIEETIRYDNKNLQLRVNYEYNAERNVIEAKLYQSYEKEMILFGTNHYEYDNRNNLISIERNDVAGPYIDFELPPEIDYFEYDEEGNMI